ncbi:MAG: UvrD-helicase domain-containing protein, partial [Thermoguttaceae bacterium]
MPDEAPFKHLIIRASAGSGKTYRLSERYLKLLLAGAPVDSILATTFTRKAAGEIQSRILARLGKGGATREGARALSKELVGDPDAISWETLRDLTVSVARSINRLRVCTLDSFFIQLAQGYAFEIGLQPGWSIIEESENNALLRSALVAAFRQTDGKRAHALAK